MEVGGKDTAIMYAVGNALASVPGMVLPPLGLWLMRKTGSYMPLFGITGAVTLLTGLWYYAVASVSAGRELLAAGRRPCTRRRARQGPGLQCSHHPLPRPWAAQDRTERRRLR
eukprot:SAG22_NODE_3043_length_1995_cov_1.829114_1_plen_113_part_00